MNTATKKTIKRHSTITSLCQIAARLNTLVLTVRDPQWTRKRLLGVCISVRAECIGRRLLGETLPPTLRRLTERAWAELCEKASVRS